MEQSEIIRIAREAGFQTNIFRSELKRFADLVAAHEREICATICDELSEKCLEEKKLEAEDTASYLGLIIRLRGLHNGSH